MFQYNYKLFTSNQILSRTLKFEQLLNNFYPKNYVRNVSLYRCGIISNITTSKCVLTDVIGNIMPNLHCCKLYDLYEQSSSKCAFSPLCSISCAINSFEEGDQSVMECLEDKDFSFAAVRVDDEETAAPELLHSEKMECKESDNVLELSAGSSEEDKLHLQHDLLESVDAESSESSFDELGLYSLFDNKSVWRTGNKIKLETKRSEQKARLYAIDGGPKNLVRPNYFVGIPISNVQVHRGVVAVQEKLLLECSDIAQSLIDVASSHITLFVIHLLPEQVPLACSALDKFCAMRSETYSQPPIKLHFEGIDNFRNQVVFVKLSEDNNWERLKMLRADVLRCFLKAGLNVQGEADMLIDDTNALMNEDASECRGILSANDSLNSNNLPPHSLLTNKVNEKKTKTKAVEWRPHLTIAKMSKMRVKKKKFDGKHGSSKSSRLSRIEPQWYKGLEEMIFGENVVSKVQLLSMTAPKDDNRYYYCERYCTLDVPSDEDEDSDHSRCCFPKHPVTCAALVCAAADQENEQEINDYIKNEEENSVLESDEKIKNDGNEINDDEQLANNETTFNTVVSDNCEQHSDNEEDKNKITVEKLPYDNTVSVSSIAEPSSSAQI